jgi:VWFA-related protein
LVVSLFAITSYPADAQDTDKPMTRFASSVDIVSLNVAVTDQSAQCFRRSPPYWNSAWDGCPLNALAAGDFEIFEDGVKQRIDIFRSNKVPIAVSVVLDTTSTNRSQTSDVLDAAMALVAKLRAGDMAQVVGSDGERDIYQALTNDRARLERAIRATRRRSSAGDGTDPLQRALESPRQSRSDEIRRHAIVYLTDGGNVSSAADIARLNLAKRSHALIYTIAMLDAPLDASGELASSLRHLAALTGGRAFFPRDGRSLSSLYSQIYDEISQQYTIGYTSTNTERNGSWRTIDVRVNRAETGTRAKQGYFAPSDR